MQPAASHPENLKRGTDWHETERWVANMYKERFFARHDIHVLRGDPRVEDNDTRIIVGSQVSSEPARKIFGLTRTARASLKASSPRGYWEAALWWNLWTPPGADAATVIQNGRPWPSTHHMLWGLGGPLVSRYGPAGPSQAENVRFREDDYLLITALPLRQRVGPRIVVFAGLHQTGTLAAGLLLGQPPIDLLETIERKTEGNQHYQALLRVHNIRGKDGSAIPKSLTLEEVRALQPRFQKG